MSRVEAGAAHGVHGLLYGLMLALPITGWSISSASTRPGAGAELFFVTHVPKIWLLRNLPLVQKVAVHDQAVLAHQIGGWLMIGLLVAHVLGALKHQFWDRQPQFARMWFGRKRPDV
jgi:cytochrome b561